MDARTAESLLNFAERAGPALRGAEAKAVFKQLDEQYGDLQLAMQWFIEQERADEALSPMQQWRPRGEPGRRTKGSITIGPWPPSLRQWVRRSSIGRVLPGAR